MERTLYVALKAILTPPRCRPAAAPPRGQPRAPPALICGRASVSPALLSREGSRGPGPDPPPGSRCCLHNPGRAPAAGKGPFEAAQRQEEGSRAGPPTALSLPGQQMGKLRHASVIVPLQAAARGQQRRWTAPTLHCILGAGVGRDPANATLRGLSGEVRPPSHPPQKMSSNAEEQKHGGSNRIP